MNFQDYQNSIFIVKDQAKERIIKKINSCNKLLNIKVITLEELKRKYFFDYGNEAFYEVAKKYGIISDIAKIYIDNIYYIKDIDNEKVKFLNEIKKYLEKNKLITYNKLFHKFLTKKRIVLVDLEDVNKFYRNIFENLKTDNEIIEISTFSSNSIKKIFKAKNKNEEIAVIASYICNLIRRGIDINKIKLANVNAEYVMTIKNIFSAFNIPIILPEESIAGTLLVSKFIELFQNNMSECFEKLKDFVKSPCDKKIYDSLVKLTNKYAWCESFEDVKEQIIKDAQNIKIPTKEYKNAIRIIDFENDLLEDDYIFLINFNLGVMPICAKNEDYFSNEIKNKLGISDSIDINRKRIENVQKRIKGSKNLVVSYSESDLNGKLYISSAYNEDDFIEMECNIDYTLSNTYNQRILTTALDEFYKFGVVNEQLPLLSYNYPQLHYMNFKNDYDGIDKNNIYKYLNNKLTLSYTSVDTYYKCAYRYYLEYILNLSKFENKIETIIGNIFHKVLSKFYNNDFDFDKEYESACNTEEYEFNEKEKHFLAILKMKLKTILDILSTQEEYTLLKNKLFEKKIIVPIDGNNVIFKGFIDKILYGEFNDKKIAAIVDYKTGDTSINLDNTKFGLSMQLPSYAYLLKHSNEFNNYTIGGFYLQKLFNDEKCKLSGYTNSDLNILEKVDVTYNDSNLINGLKMGSNGLYKSARVLTSAEIDELCALVEIKIKEAARNILNANFQINPKEINNKNVGCQYCDFKSICYMKNADITKLGGDDNAELD